MRGEFSNGFEQVERQLDPPALERRVLERWHTRDVLRSALASGERGRMFRFYEGPPTANGAPGVHHVEARVFKDVFPRHRAMKGHLVPRKAGWDCHGIPVELEVERALGLTSKTQIERFGIGAFNKRCRESVTRYVAQFEALTERIGFWVDTDDAYWTMSPEYVQSVWWSLKWLFDEGLIYQGDRVVPYCPRCGTALSDHEVAQGYAEVEDPSIYVRLPLIDGPLAAEGAHLLIWTTMPWTLVPTTLAVVGPDIRYVLARGGRAGDHPVVLAAERVEVALGDGAEIVREVTHNELLGSHYCGPFNLVGPGSPSEPEGDAESWRFVVADNFVELDEGTGIVHTGAAFGEDDMRVARAHGLPVVNPVDAAGRFRSNVGPYAGLYIRDADRQIITDLDSRGLLVHSSKCTHTFPFCWRCETPLFYYAKACWYIATTSIRERLLRENAEVDWRPPHIRDGRYGDWIAGNVDWALSRERYWGTPLPLWRCQNCQHVVAVGSLAELSERADVDLTGLDPHRPFIDEIAFTCEACGEGAMQRTPEVVDAWYDSGAMPFAQFGYPHAPGSSERLAEVFPADYICEAIDQTRGWFYSLHAIATLLFGCNAYRRVLCLGHIVDAEGRKMSKSTGNVRDPWELIDTYGADALRWLLLVEGSPWQPRRVDNERLSEIVRKLLMTIWSTHFFFVTYANLANWTPRRDTPPVARRPVLDRYILAELTDTTAVVDEALENFDITTAGRRLRSFVEELSNWYLRCSRTRFSARPADASSDLPSVGVVADADSDAAFATLYTCLTTLSALIAPLIPFIADELYEGLVGRVTPDAPASVHLTAYPAPVQALRDDDLRAQMAVVRRLTTLGRDARASAGIPLRQPLYRALLTVSSQDDELGCELLAVLAAELNVHTVERASVGVAGAVTLTLKPDFRTLGPRFGKRTQAAAAAILHADPERAVAALLEEGRFAIKLDDELVSITREQVQIVEQPVTGWNISSDGPYSVALDTTIGRDLRLEGFAREMIRAVNDLRKRRNLDLADSITLHVTLEHDPDGEIAATLDTHEGEIVRGVGAHAVRRHDRGSTWDESASLYLGEGLLVFAAQRDDHHKHGTQPS